MDEWRLAQWKSWYLFHTVQYILHSTCNSLGSCPNFISRSSILSDSFFFLVRIRICSYMADYPTSIYIITGHAVHKGPKESILETLFVYLLRSLPRRQSNSVATSIRFCVQVRPSLKPLLLWVWKFSWITWLNNIGGFKYCSVRLGCRKAAHRRVSSPSMQTLQSIEFYLILIYSRHMPTSPLHHIETDRKWCVNKRRDSWGMRIDHFISIWCWMGRWWWWQ